jgi:hypothetical protein
LIALTLALAASGCPSDPKCGDGESQGDAGCEASSTGPDGNGNGTGDKATSFESDLTSGSASQQSARGGVATGDSSGEADSAASAPTAPGAQRSAANGNPAAERAITEADIIQVQGDKLYALSRIAGLSVIDVSDPSALRLIGRFRELPATPFEMYVRDGVALVMFTGWGQYSEADDGTVSWVSTSKLLALDVSDSANITQLGTFDVPGEISDSRIVGDVLYIVGHESGYCWRCVQDKPRTSILSLNVADPRNVQKVDELFYNEDNQSWGQRSVTVTSERMYVAGPEYGQTEPTGSTIQVIDISDAAGDLVEGGTATVQGQVNNRWQMDEYQGVLRVVSQAPQRWNGNGTPVITPKPAIETFKIESSDKLTKLGRTDITIPNQDTLRSVRFDGFRGYAITAEQKDPLFTLDLSDPANPRQVGELKIPGFVYHMEPRGNRVVGLGFDQGNPAGGIAVSLFDVTNLAAPVELTRVNFGGNWGSLPEDQNRIHKVFRVLDDAGLILVPYSGWSNVEPVEDGDCYVSSYSGGVQIIDFANDTLTARGSAASQGGETRRALIVDEALLSVADERVQSFDISDRDKPTQISQVVLSRNTQRAVQLDNDVVARINADYNRGDYEVDFVASSDVEDPNRSYSTLNLTELVTQNDSACEKSFSLEQTFAHGSTLEVLYSGYSYSRGADSGEVVRGLLVIDASDAAEPKLVSDVQWNTGQWQPYYGFYSYGYYGYSSPVVRTEKALALMEETWESTATTSTQKVRLRVIDLRDLTNVKTTLFPFQTVSQFSGLHADGEVVLTSHLEPTSQDGRRGKFYIDRFDIADPAAPKQLSKINVPGALMSFDSPSRRALTSEQVRVLVSGKISAEDCYKRFANAEWNTDSQGNNVAVASPPVARGGSSSSSGQVDNPPPVLGTCTGFKQRLNLVHVLGDAAELDDRLELADDKQVFSFSKGDGVVFASVGRGGYYYPRAAIDCWGPCGGGSLQPTELLVLGGFAQGAFEEGYITVDDSEANNWYGFWGSPPVYAYGKRALLAGQGELVVIDASNAADPQLVKRLPAIGTVQYAEVHEENALLTFGQQGVQWVDLRD